MFYILAKLFWLLFEPTRFLVLLVILAGILLALGYTLWGRRLAIAAALIAFVFAVLPSGVWLLRPIENSYRLPHLPSHVDGIVVLGGGQDARVLLRRGMQGVDAADERLISAYALARRHPEAVVLFSGAPEEAPVARYLLTKMGLPPGRLLVESRSFDTWENLRNSRAIAHPRPEQVWVLATSAYQLPRAMNAARRLDWAMIPYPTDYRTAPGLNFSTRLGRNLKLSDLALHEWIGRLAYALDGRASAKLTPAPSS